ADTDDLVKILAAPQIAVVQQLQSDPVLQPGLRRASVGQLELRLAQGNAMDLDVIETGRVARQSPPAAAHIQQSLAGFEPQLAAQVIELLGLGSGQTVLGIAEVAT